MNGYNRGSASASLGSMMRTAGSAVVAVVFGAFDLLWLSPGALMPPSPDRILPPRPTLPPSRYEHGDRRP